MSIEHPTTGLALEALRAALAQLREVANVPSADPFYAQAAEQVAGIVAGIEKRQEPAPGAVPSPSQGLDPVPPDPG